MQCVPGISSACSSPHLHCAACRICMLHVPATCCTFLIHQQPCRPGPRIPASKAQSPGPRSRPSRIPSVPWDQKTLPASRFRPVPSPFSYNLDIHHAIPFWKPRKILPLTRVGQITTTSRWQRLASSPRGITRFRIMVAPGFGAGRLKVDGYDVEIGGDLQFLTVWGGRA